MKMKGKRYKKDSSGKFGKAVVIVCIAVALVYTGAITINFFVSGVEPTTLTVAVFGFFGTELGLCALKRVLCGKNEAANHKGKECLNDDSDIETEIDISDGLY